VNTQLAHSAAVALPDLPFFAGVESRPRAVSKLPFALTCDADGLVRQAPNTRVNAALAHAYAQGSALSTEPGADGYAAARATELVDALERAAGGVRSKDVLEIGCGGGFVLAELARRGARVRGCELGPAALEARYGRGLDVTHAPFGTGLFAPASCDLVFSSMLVEHLDDVDGALREMSAILRPHGVLVCAVPSCGELLARGDINLAAHEHKSYFTPVTLAARIARAGMADVSVSETRATLSLHAVARKGPAAPLRSASSPTAPRTSASDLARFADRLAARVELLTRRAGALRGKRLALCGASLAASAIAGWIDLTEVDVRVYERDPEKLGRFLPGLRHAIASDDALAADAPDEIWVLPFLHGARIRERLITAHGFDPARVLAVSELELA
jgi:SAM-dependent methyltransferase